MTIELKDGTTTEDPRLDRLVQTDARNANYPVRALLGATRGPRSYTWGVPGGVGQVLDQGREGACVGFAFAGDRAARPVPGATTNADALAVYRRAQQLDPWEGEAPTYHGTSVLAGAQAATERGWLVEYRWAETFADVLDTLGYLGPVVFGIPWYESMYEAPGGRVTVSGAVVGGHAILGRGVSHRRREVLLRNSWGPDWGVDGDAAVSFDDLERLFADGEACVPVRR